MKMQMLPPSRLKPYEKNAKLHNDAAIRYSVENFKMDQPIVVDGDMVVIKGHGRLEAANELKLAKVPVIIRTDLTPEQAKAARIADNKSAEAPWDYVKLDDELRELHAGDWDLEAIGFDEDELTRALKLDDEGDRGDDDGEQEFGKGLGQPVISATIVFDDEDQHANWQAFTRWLKGEREEETNGARLAGYACEVLP